VALRGWIGKPLRSGRTTAPWSAGRCSGAGVRIMPAPHSAKPTQAARAPPPALASPFVGRPSSASGQALTRHVRPSRTSQRLRAGAHHRFAPGAARTMRRHAQPTMRHAGGARWERKPTMYWAWLGPLQRTCLYIGTGAGKPERAASMPRSAMQSQGRDLCAPSRDATRWATASRRQGVGAVTRLTRCVGICPYAPAAGVSTCDTHRTDAGPQVAAR
jgi:hypothetical protein